MSKLSEAIRPHHERLTSYISDNQYLFLALIVIFLGALWRIWGLGTFKGFSKDELILLENAKSLISNHWIPGGSISGVLFTAKLASVGSLLGYSQIVFRLFSAIIGVTASIFFFLFVRSWFNKQIALVATLLMATNATMLIFSSVLSPTMLIITLQMAILYFATIAFRDKNVWFFLLSAVLSALGVFLSPYFVIMGILIFLASLTMTAKNPKIFKIYRFELIALILPIVLALAGYGYLMRGQMNEIVNYINPGSFADFYLNVGKNLLTLFSGSEYVSTVSVSIEPILDPFVAVSAVCGIVYAFFHGGKRKHQFVLLWLLFGLIVISLTKIQTMMGLTLILPVIFIISGIMLDYLLTSWVRTFPYNKSARLVMTLLFSLFLFLSIYYNFQKFFYGWQGNPKISSQYSILLDK